MIVNMTVIVLFVAWFHVVRSYYNIPFDRDAFNVGSTEFSGEWSYDKSKARGQSIYFFDINPGGTLPWPVGNSCSGTSCNGQYKCSSISFVFKEMSMTSAELDIMELQSLSIFYSCISCQTSDRVTALSPQHSYMPPIFNSSTGSVRISARGGASTSTSSSFTIQWVCNMAYTTVQDQTKSVTVDLAMGYGTVRPLLSTHVTKTNGVNKLVAKLGPGAVQTFWIRNPNKWYYSSTNRWYYSSNCPGDGVWCASTVQGSQALRLAVTMVRWPSDLCVGSNGVSLKIYKGTTSNELFNACSPQPTDKQWLLTGDDGIAKV